MDFISKTNQKGTLLSGDVFVIPLDNGQYSLGMFHKYIEKPLYSAVCSFYPSRVTSPDQITEAMLTHPISIKRVVTAGLDTKLWEIVAHCPSKVSEKALPDKNYRKRFLRKKSPVNEKVYGDGIIRNFLKAYHGLIAWNSMHNPHYFDELLLDTKLRPETIVLE